MYEVLGFYFILLKNIIIHEKEFIPGTYRNIHGEIVRIVPRPFILTTRKLYIFNPIFQYSNISLFHERTKRRLLTKKNDNYNILYKFQYVFLIPHQPERKTGQPFFGCIVF
jgi:hypothetical protein